jgi:hypothetical protein
MSRHHLSLPMMAIGQSQAKAATRFSWEDISFIIDFREIIRSSKGLCWRL